MIQLNFCLSFQRSAFCSLNKNILRASAEISKNAGCLRLGDFSSKRRNFLQYEDAVALWLK